MSGGRGGTQGAPEVGVGVREMGVRPPKKNEYSSGVGAGRGFVGGDGGKAEGLWQGFGDRGCGGRGGGSSRGGGTRWVRGDLWEVGEWWTLGGGR